MRQTWQWKPNQRVVHVHYHGRGRYRQRYPVLAIVGAVFGVMVIIAAIVAVL